MTFLAAMLVACMGIYAQKAMKAPAGGKAISDELLGIFFEDIGSAADGGSRFCRRRRGGNSKGEYQRKRQYRGQDFFRHN